MMRVNCGFVRKQYRWRKRRQPYFQHQNVAGIELSDKLDRDNDSREIRRQLMRHAPKGKGWEISGYYFCDETD